MAFINVTSPEQAKGKLEKLYRLIGGPSGQIDQVLQVHSLRPHTLEGHMALYKAVLHHTANRIPEWFLEAIGAKVSHLNGCDYCHEHHLAGMIKSMTTLEMDSGPYVAALQNSEPGLPFSGQEQAALLYATRLTTAPATITQQDIDLLKERGLSDGEILEINQVTAYFAYANRTVTGLGVTTMGELIGLSPQSGEGREAWAHD
jgi:uncharacterized peroxidase-related enzyme